MTTEPAAPVKKGRPKRQWAPYLLILPSLIYLAIFFALPMVRAIRLAVWDETALLTLHEEASARSSRVGVLPQGSQVSLLERQGIAVAPDELVGKSCPAGPPLPRPGFALRGMTRTATA